MKIFAALFGVCAFLSLIPAYAEERSSPQEGKVVCEEKTVEMLSSTGLGTGKFIQVANCQITCPGGSTSTTCQPNETCNCECRPSGLPGCSCHPRHGVIDEEAQRVQSKLPGEDSVTSGTGPRVQ